MRADVAQRRGSQFHGTCHGSLKGPAPKAERVGQVCGNFLMDKGDEAVRVALPAGGRTVAPAKDGAHGISFPRESLTEGDMEGVVLRPN